MTNSDLRQRALRIIELEAAAKEAKLDVDAAYEAAASSGYTKAALKEAIKQHFRLVEREMSARVKHDKAPERDIRNPAGAD